MTPEQIKKIRAATGLSQRAFAAEIGVTQATVHNWERVGKKPSGAARKALEALAKRHGISVKIVHVQPDYSIQV